MKLWMWLLSVRFFTLSPNSITRTFQEPKSTTDCKMTTKENIIYFKSVIFKWNLTLSDNYWKDLQSTTLSWLTLYLTFPNIKSSFLIEFSWVLKLVSPSHQSSCGRFLGNPFPDSLFSGFQKGAVSTKTSNVSLKCFKRSEIGRRVAYSFGETE